MFINKSAGSMGFVGLAQGQVLVDGSDCEEHHMSGGGHRGALLGGPLID